MLVLKSSSPGRQPEVKIIPLQVGQLCNFDSEPRIEESLCLI